jgi:hypothetical protein
MASGHFFVDTQMASGHCVLAFIECVNMTSRNLPKIMVRLPRDVKTWLMEQAAENASSQSSEIVRAVRERMARCGVGSQDQVSSPPSPNDKPTSAEDR